MRTRILLALVALPLGCSVINSFDDVNPIVAAMSGGGGSGGGNSGGDAGSENQGGDAGSMNTGGSSGGSGGGSGGTVEVLPGLLVMQAEDTAAESSLVLSVLSPQTGEELAREPGAFPGIAYDSSRDIWFVLRSDSELATPLPGDTITLEARKFDRATNEWEILTETPVEVPLPLDERQLYALNERVVLLAYDDVTTNTGQAIVYDTSDPNAIEELDGSPVSLGSLSDRVLQGAMASPLPVGGSVNLLRRNCSTTTGAGCDIELDRIAAIDDASLPTSTPIGTVPDASYAVAGTYNWGDEKLTIAFPYLDATSPNVAYIQQFHPITHSPEADQYQFPSAAQLRVAVDPCVGVAYVTNPLESKARAVPLSTSAALATLELDHLSKGLVLEPFTHTMLAPFDSATDFEVTAFEILGDQNNPDFKKRLGDWAPPSKLRPLVVVSALAAEANEVCQ